MAIRDSSCHCFKQAFFISFFIVDKQEMVREAAQAGAAVVVSPLQIPKSPRTFEARTRGDTRVLLLLLVVVVVV